MATVSNIARSLFRYSLSNAPLRTVRISKCSPGQALVEFALVSWLFLIVAFGILELGHAYFTYSSLTNAVREGARYAIVDPNNTSGIKNKVTSTGYLMNLTVSNVGVETPGGGPVTSAGTPITITAVYTYQPLINLVLPTVPMNAASIMIVEAVPSP